MTQADTEMRRAQVARLLHHFARQPGNLDAQPLALSLLAALMHAGKIISWPTLHRN